MSYTPTIDVEYLAFQLKSIDSNGALVSQIAFQSITRQAEAIARSYLNLYEENQILRETVEYYEKLLNI